MIAPSFWVGIGALSGFLAVALGAFAAHGLAEKVEPRLLEVFRTGAHYELIHALALLFVGLWAGQHPGRASVVAGVCFSVGTVFFSGSLYALALSGQRWLGAITPIGGLLFLAGWAALGWSALRSSS